MLRCFTFQTCYSLNSSFFFNHIFLFLRYLLTNNKYVQVVVVVGVIYMYISALVCPPEYNSVHLISVTICSLIFFICTPQSAGLRPWQNRFLVLVAHKFKLRWNSLKFPGYVFLGSGNLSTNILHHSHALACFGRAFQRARCRRL